MSEMKEGTLNPDLVRFAGEVRVTGFGQSTPTLCGLGIFYVENGVGYLRIDTMLERKEGLTTSALRISTEDNYFVVAWRATGADPWMVIGHTARQKKRVGSDEFIDNMSDHIVADRGGEAIIVEMTGKPLRHRERFSVEWIKAP